MVGVALASNAVLTPTRTATPILIDGFLDEEAWASAGVIDELISYEPKEAPPHLRPRSATSTTTRTCTSGSLRSESPDISSRHPSCPATRRWGTTGWASHWTPIEMESAE